MPNSDLKQIGSQPSLLLSWQKVSGGVMENKPKIEIEKVTIPDVKKGEPGAELSDKEQDKVSGGGAGYGYNGSDGS